MNKSKLSVLLIAFLAIANTTLFAAAEKETTIKGEAQCAKCSLKKADKCSGAIVANEGEKEVVYYIVDTETSKKDLPHSEICTAKKKVEAKGTVKEVDGKKQLTATSIVAAK
ncbi:MAG: DUF6370 family protein [Verrucomicrobiota bacterium]|nr:DUF6370 family protein [Verrucomicrobiota bacterium]